MPQGASMKWHCAAEGERAGCAQLRMLAHLAASPEGARRVPSRTAACKEYPNAFLLSVTERPEMHSMWLTVPLPSRPPPQNVAV